MEEVLQCRTARDKRQKELLTRGGQCLVSFSMNIPGDMKQFPLAKSAFEVGMEELQNMAALGDVADAKLRALVGGNMGDVLPIVEHTAAFGLYEPHNGLNQSAFAGSVGTDDRDKFAGADADVDSVENLHHERSGCRLPEAFRADPPIKYWARWCR